MRASIIRAASVVAAAGLLAQSVEAGVAAPVQSVQTPVQTSGAGDRDLGLIIGAVAVGIVAVAGGVTYVIVTRGGKVKGKVKGGGVEMSGEACLPPPPAPGAEGPGDTVMLDPLTIPGANMGTQTLTMTDGASGQVMFNGGGDTDYLAGGMKNVQFDGSVDADFSFIATSVEGKGGPVSLVFDFDASTMLTASVTETNPLSVGFARFKLSGGLLDSAGEYMGDLFSIQRSVSGVGTESETLSGPFTVEIPVTALEGLGSSFDARFHIDFRGRGVGVPAPGAAAPLLLLGAWFGRRRRLEMAA